MNWDNLLTKEQFIKRDDSFELLDRNDYDTIICSTLFRRLQDKAQVFPLEDDDYVRTRLTHSLEVSAIGKKLGEYVFNRLKELHVDEWFENHTAKDFSDVLLCAGLIHDIGNPPFGHFGEYAIREWFQNNVKDLRLGEIRVSDFLTEGQLEDLYMFEGNAQSLRLLSKTPYLGETNGFNLSYAVLGSIIKYPICSEMLKRENVVGYKKIGYYHSEKQLFREIDLKTGMNGCRHPLSYLLEAADDIAYRTSDLEDAMVKKVISFHQICRVFEQYMEKMEKDQKVEKEVTARISLLHQLYQEEITRNKRKPELTSVQRWNQCMKEIMIKEAGDVFVEHYMEIMEGNYKGDLFKNTASECLTQMIAHLSERYIYTSSIKTRTELYGRRVIHSLMSQFMPAAILYDTGYKMSFIEKRTIDTVSNFYKSMYHDEAQGKTEQERMYLRILMITDYISGMTDNYAKKLYQDLFS